MISTTGDFKCGYIAVVGCPNTGKSTLVNALLGQKIAIVSAKPQTTRRMQLGIHTTAHEQFLFYDTPGVQRPRTVLGKSMAASANRAFSEADVLLWVVDVSRRATGGDKGVARRLREDACGKPVVLAMNKSDRLRADRVVTHTDSFRALAPQATWMLVSATRGDNLRLLLEQLGSELPNGPRLYPDDQVTDARMRELASELVREAALHHLEKEIPHGVGVEVEGFDEQNGGPASISVIVVVEHERHKGIVIGKRGEMLKRIGVRARKEIETMLGTDVYLRTHVKVRKEWRNDPRQVASMGY